MMKISKLMDSLEEVGMTPKCFCELVSENSLQRFIRGYHKTFHDDKSRTASEFYAKRTSALTTLSRISESELSELARALEKEPSYTEKIKQLEDKNLEVREVLEALKKKFIELSNTNKDLIEELDTLRTSAKGSDSAEFTKCRRKISSIDSYLSTLSELAVTTFGDEKKFALTDYPHVYNFLREAKKLSKKFHVA